MRGIFSTECEIAKYKMKLERFVIIVDRCLAGGSMRACHAAGPGSIPGRDKFPG